MNNKIGLLDSGLGGLSILKELLNSLPNENYLFYEDSINNPYGTKTDEELYSIVSNIVEYLLKQDCKMIVVACNTATTSCIKRLREDYKDTIFIGTEPAIKVACDNNYQNIINLSTPSTRQSKRVQSLINTYKKDNQNIYNISGENLANLIELDQKEEINNLLNRVLKDYKYCDALVLGCTHYSLIKKEISKILPNTVLLDGTIGVREQVKRKLIENNLLNLSDEKGTIEIINSKDDNLIQRSYEILNIDKEQKKHLF